MESEFLRAIELFWVTLSFGDDAEAAAHRPAHGRRRRSFVNGRASIPAPQNRVGHLFPRGRVGHLFSTEQRSSMEPGQIGALIADLKERSDALWRYL